MGYPALALIGLVIGGCGRIGYDAASRPIDDSVDASTTLFDARQNELVDAAPDIDAQVEVPCAFTCSFDYAGGSTDCGSGAITFQLLSPGDPSVLRADMSGMTSLEATIEVCDPVGPVFQIADSATNGLLKSDTGTTSNDAHLLLLGTGLEFFRNDFGTGSQSYANFVSATGCSTRTIIVSDQRIELMDDTIVDPAALRLDPPTDVEGSSDRLWYLGINRVVDTAASDEGSGLVDMTFCLR